MSTNDGQNLLEPGQTPHENIQFLVFLCAVIKAVDDYSDLLRLSVASAGNDHRLGANEAPPAIVSVFLGDQLTDILMQLENGKAKGKSYNSILETGVASLPKLPKDATDRNRTSPFAFTGNKFEFRMLGSSASIAGCNFVLNTIVAEILQKFADKLEAASDFTNAVGALLAETVRDHKKIIFNGNNYSEEWVSEAESRGLPNLKSTVECIPTFIKDKNVAVFVKHGILSKSEIESRYEILLENYIKVINIEALTMISMAKTEIMPSAFKYSKELSDTINAVKETGMSVEVSAQSSVLKELSPVLSSFASNIQALKKAVEKASSESGLLKEAEAFHKLVVPAMEALRADGDKLEAIIPKDIYPFPTYAELLFNI